MLRKMQFKNPIILDIAVLVILIVLQSPLHEASHALAVIILGGAVDTIAINVFDPEQSYVAYRLAYSDYSELFQAIIKLLTHLFLGIIAFYLVHKGINRIKLAGKNAVDKYTYLLMGLLYLGIGSWRFLPLRYLSLRPYHQFDIPQATQHLSNFARFRFPEWALFFNHLPAEFQMRLLIFGLIGLLGMIYVGLWLAFGQSDEIPLALKRGATAGSEKSRWEGEPDAPLLG